MFFSFQFLLDCIESQREYKMSKLERKQLNRLKDFFDYFPDGKYKNTYMNNNKFLKSINYDVIKIFSIEEIRKCDVKELLEKLYSDVPKEDFEEICSYFRDTVAAYESKFEWEMKNLKDAKDFVYQITGV